MTTAIILAGGLGTRLREAVSELPKPMAPVAGRPFLAHQMEHWRRCGIDAFVLSVGYRHEAIVEHFGDAFDGAPIAYAIEDTPLGTGGGLLRAMQCLDDEEPFLLLNGDTYFDVGLEQLLEAHTMQGAGITMALFRATEPDRFGGVRMDATGRITEFRSGRAETGQLANGGVYMISPRVIAARYKASNDKLSFEDQILPDLFETGVAFFGMESDGRFIDIGVPRDYQSAEAVLSSV